MKYEDLTEEISVELESMDMVVKELLSLLTDVAGREPTLREKTAAAGFLAQFYNGIENMLKRMSQFHNIPLPSGETWHAELFRRFCFPSYDVLPFLFDESLAAALAPFRKFRHVVYHGYGFQLDWDRMKEGISGIENIFVRFKSKVVDYLKTLESR